MSPFICERRQFKILDPNLTVLGLKLYKSVNGEDYSLLPIRKMSFRTAMTDHVRGWNASQSNGSDQTLLLFTQTDGGEATAAASSL